MVGLLFAIGCADSTRRQPAVEVQVEAEGDDRPRLPTDPTAKLPKPDAARIHYDPNTRTLVLYDLPDAAAKWMLHVPEQSKGVPVNSIHQFMDEIDPDRVAVFYTTADGQPSPRVTLREVLAARNDRVQR
jgi:hypothetical protein